MRFRNCTLPVLLSQHKHICQQRGNDIPHARLTSVQPEGQTEKVMQDSVKRKADLPDPHQVS